MQGNISLAHEHQLQDLLLPFFEERNFKLLRGLRQFQKVTSYGFLNVILSPSVQDGCLIVEINTGYRFDMVEDLANQFYPHLKGFRPFTNTLIANIGKLKNEQYFRYELSLHEDMAILVQDIQSDLECFVLPFLDQVKNIYDLDRMLNNEPLHRCPWIHNQNQRCIKGLIAAKMSGNSEFHNLYVIYLRFMDNAGAPKVILDAFNTLYKHLSSVSLN